MGAAIIYLILLNFHLQLYTKQAPHKPTKTKIIAIFIKRRVPSDSRILSLSFRDRTVHRLRLTPY